LGGRGTPCFKCEQFSSTAQKEEEAEEKKLRETLFGIELKKINIQFDIFS
jgi:hypothetical protein